jgi:hypothetical protein
MAVRIPIPADGDWAALRRAIALLARSRLSEDSSQAFNELQLEGLTGTRLVRSDTTKKLVSVADLTDWVKAGTGITVTDEGDGTATIDCTVVGETDHAELDNLDYDSAGHTGFEPTITAGTISQYWRGDKTWQTLPSGTGGITKVSDEDERLALETEEGDLVYQLDDHNLYIRVS